jgi:hypothetical protein
MTMIILTILGCILFTFIVLNTGYKLAMDKFKPKETAELITKQNETIEELRKINDELVDGVKKLDETQKANTQWYFTQIQTLGQYLKDKHDDNYVFDRMGSLLNQGLEHKKEYNLDDILDKISNEGFESLSDDEKDYLHGIK